MVLLLYICGVSVIPKIPVVLIDTGYLFPETYRFIDDLADRLKLNLKVFRSDASPASQESRFGKLWDQGLAGIEQYNRINKQEPLDRALRELGRRLGSRDYAGLRPRRGLRSRRSSSSAGAIRCIRSLIGPIAMWACT